MAKRAGPRRVPGLTLVLALLVACLTALMLMRQGAFDFAQPQGMVDRPCETRGAASHVLLGEGERYRLRDWADLCRFRKDNARLVAGGARPRVVMIGDSITEGWAREDPGFFTGGVVDRGIVGQTSAQMLLRFEQDVVALRPRAVHILAGLNDIAGNTGLNRPEDFQANIRAMVAIAEANGITVVLASMPPARGFYWRPGIDPRDRIAELNAWLKRFAAERGLVFADYHAVLADSRGLAKPPFDGDGVHPTAAAYAAMKPVAEAAIAAAEAKAGPKAR